jgi:Uma2 family endonuclease
MAMPQKQMARWTLAEVHRLPDDGNRYELVHGELFVTPAPSYAHQSIIAVLTHRLYRYVEEQKLGHVHTARAVVRRRGSEVEPDIMVRPIPRTKPRNWEAAPVPLLVVEVLSGSTRRRDHEQKHAFYREIGVPEYWIVDGYERTIRVVSQGHEDVMADAIVSWHPAGAGAALVVDVRAFFEEALG